MSKNKTQLPNKVTQDILPPVYSDEARESDIAIAAYYRAHDRGFEPGYELEDWLAAEQEKNAI
jgi:hypothetical protein